MTNREKLIEDLKTMSIEDFVHVISLGYGCEYCIHRDREICEGCDDTCDDGMKAYFEQEVDDAQ